jgi:CheY-like chemotaxis protein
LPLLRVVTSNNTAIFRELKSPSFQQLEMQQVVVTTGTDALQKIREHVPDLAVLDVDLPDMSGTDVCKLVKGDKKLAKVRVILVVSGSLSRDDVDRLADCGCDDILTIPTPAEDLYSHAARLLNLPQPQRSRVRAQVLMPSGSRTPVLRGDVQSIALESVDIAVEQSVELGTEVKLRLGRTGSGQAVLVKGTVVACEGDKQALTKTLRVKLHGLRPEDERALADLALWEVVERRGGVLVMLRGDIVEKTSFDALLGQLSSLAITFDMAGVRYLNSTGIRRWVEFLERIDSEAQYEFVRCSVAFVTQLGLVSRAVGRGHVVSFMAPYYCEMCDRESQQLLQTKALAGAAGAVPVAPAFDCPQCGSPLEFDELPERFFAFMQAAR